MSEHKLLQIFTFSDNFGWSIPEIQEEAFNAATRRAEAMEWSDIRIKLISTNPELDGDVRIYRFEIWGVGESVLDPSDIQDSTKENSESFKKVAREVDL
jgi:hypothetical protein